MCAFAQFNQTPGPGTYKPENYNKQPKIQYSMARKYNDLDKNKTPGPGTYKRQSFLDNKKAITFPRDMSNNVLINKELMKTPGPGIYE